MTDDLMTELTGISRAGMGLRRDDAQLFVTGVCYDCGQPFSEHAPGVLLYGGPDMVHQNPRITCVLYLQGQIHYWRKLVEWTRDSLARALENTP